MSKRLLKIILWSVLVIAAVLLVVFLNRSDGDDEPPVMQWYTDSQPVIEGLTIPWEMEYLAPGTILFTELGGTVSKLDLKTGEREVLQQFTTLAREIQAGLMGLAVHRAETDTTVFLAYNYYQSDSIWTRIEAWSLQHDTLDSPEIVVDGIPAFSISNGGRLDIIEGKLWLTTGEGSDSDAAQDDQDLKGKVLRFNLDGSIPKDNPGPGPVYAMGFRNPQGLVATPQGVYVSEHGTFSNDELNRIEPGGNYGWPLQSGTCDSCGGDGLNYALTSWTPTVAPSGMAYSGDHDLSFMQNSVLVACLKGQRVKVVQLSQDGIQITAEHDMAVNTLGRIRDVMVTPQGEIYVATSNADVYGRPGLAGDGIFALHPRDSMVEVQKRRLTPPAVISLDSTQIEVNVVASRLRLPWELVWVQGKIWFNERGGAIKRLDPGTGKIRVVHQITDVFESSDNSGMHGFTVHPDYPVKPYLYGHYTFELYKSRLVRYTVDTGSLKVVGEEVLIGDLEGNKSHNGSRLVFGPDEKLYFCIGDAYSRKAAQKQDRYNGKIHRLNEDGSIPRDNPIPGNSLYTLGHRNPQGLAWGSNGNLYSSEHGSSNDDEINIILPGRNYGFPNVQGICDGWSEERFCENYNVVEPIYSWTPTIGPTGIEYFDHPSIPEWRHSLLVATLKSGNGSEGQRLLVAHLSPEGDAVQSVDEYLTYSFGRLRDVMMAPDGRVFIATSNQESNQNALEIVQDHDDRIIELRAASDTGVAGK